MATELKKTSFAVDLELSGELIRILAMQASQT